ncbi:MAG: TerB family tellurite resistance protein [Methylocella sp.]
MFDALKSFIAELAGAGSSEKIFAENDYRLAAATLLVHVAAADGATDEAERRRLKTVIEERFGLDDAATARLIEKAEESDRDAVDFYQFTSVLKRALDEEGRLKVVEMMWDIAFADGEVHEFEENAIWRIAELLGVSTRDRALLRLRVGRELRSGAGRKAPGARRGPAKIEFRARPEPGGARNSPAAKRRAESRGERSRNGAGAWTRGRNPTPRDPDHRRLGRHWGRSRPRLRA